MQKRPSAGSEPSRSSGAKGKPKGGKAASRGAKEQKTTEVRARLEAQGSGRGSRGAPLFGLRDSHGNPAGASACDARGDDGSDGRIDIEATQEIILVIKFDCDMKDIFTENGDSSLWALKADMDDCYSVLLKARSRTNPHSRTPRPTVVTLAGQREQVRHAYAAFYERVKKQIRDRKIIAAPEDAFRAFPLPPIEDVALSRPIGSSRPAQVHMSVPRHDSEEESLEEPPVLPPTPVACPTLLRETEPAVWLQDHLLFKPPKASSSQEQMLGPDADELRAEFSDADKEEFKRACHLALERTKARMDKHMGLSS